MKAKKIIAAIVIVSCITNSIILSSCSSTKEDDYSSSNNNSSNNNYSTINTISESEAISIAKQSSKVQNKIADYWDMKFFYTPDWGTCTARKVGDDWYVTLKGNISGYTDDYKKDFIYDKTFKVTVTVSSSGNITSVVYVSIN